MLIMRFSIILRCLIPKTFTTYGYSKAGIGNGQENVDLKEVGGYGRFISKHKFIYLIKCIAK